MRNRNGAPVCNRLGLPRERKADYKPALHPPDNLKIELQHLDGHLFDVSKKSAKIAALIDRHRGQELSPYYLGYFELFNAQLFYESHDVLEELWLADRKGPNGDFYKGLIQLAGAFVHLQKNRLRPSAALFKLARANLEKYPALHEQLDLVQLLSVIEDWLTCLEGNDFKQNPLASRSTPQIILLDKKL